MKETFASWHQLLRLCATLPETVRNCLRFRVFFLLPRCFRMPAKIRVAGQSVALRFPREEGIAADFITCILRNSYGLGRSLGAVHTILDIGANVGFFSLAARGHYPAATIHAYEPNPRVQEHLRANTEELRIQTYPEALGAGRGFVAMIDEGPSDQARTVACEDAGSGIRQICLETAIERIGGAVDLLKLDCEGAEWEILTPGSHWSRVRHLRLEYHSPNGETLQQACEAVARCGFQILHAAECNDYGGSVWATRQPES